MRQSKEMKEILKQAKIAEQQRKMIETQRKLSELNKELLMLQKRLNILRNCKEQKECILKPKIEERKIPRERLSPYATKWTEDVVTDYLISDSSGNNINCQKYLYGVLDCDVVNDIFNVYHNLKPIYIKENEPLWQLLVLDYIDYTERTIQKYQEDIAKILKEYEGKSNEV